jgi:hypothetical protein
VLSVEKVVTGLRWRQAQPHVTVLGTPAAGDLAAATELGGALAARLVL